METFRSKSIPVRGDSHAMLLVLQIEGSSVVEQDERTAALMPGDITLIDWSRPLRVQFQDGCRVLVLFLAFAQEPPDEPPPRLARLRLLPSYVEEHQADVTASDVRLAA